MSQPAPSWLQNALGSPRAGHGGLAIAKLGSERAMGRGGFSVKSPAFADGEELDPCFTADEEDAVAPPFEWTAPPPGTQEIVLIAEDADSASPEPSCHWLVWGMPGQKGQLLEGEVPPRVGKNAHGNSEWLLPEIAHGGPQHQFVFQVFALELPMTIMPGATREDVMASMKGQVTACAVTTATYAGSEEGDKGDWDEEEF